MEKTSSFPTARAIQTKFFEKQYPGNLGSISSDLKEVAKDISLVYQSKQTIDIEGDLIDIPKEALEFAVRSYQIIELKQRRKFDIWRDQQQEELDINREKLTDAQTRISSTETELNAKKELLTIKDEQLQEVRQKLRELEQKVHDAESTTRTTEFKNNELSTELNSVKKQFSDQKQQFDQEISFIKKQHANTIDSIKEQFLDNMVQEKSRHREMEAQLQSGYEERLKLKEEMVHSKEAELKKLDDKHITLDDKYRLLISDHQTIKAVNDELDSKLSLSSSERDDYREENTQIKSETISLMNNISGLTASNDALCEERNIQKTQIDDLSDVIQKLNGKIQSFEGYLQGLSGQ